jgi:hypothetical protein
MSQPGSAPLPAGLGYGSAGRWFCPPSVAGGGRGSPLQLPPVWGMRPVPAASPLDFPTESAGSRADADGDEPPSTARK